MIVRSLSNVTKIDLTGLLPRGIVIEIFGELSENLN
jgi:RecA/RadA recombinase